MKNFIVAVLVSLFFVGCGSASKFAPISKNQFTPHLKPVTVFTEKPKNCVEVGWVTASQSTMVYEWLDILEVAKTKAAQNGANGVVFNPSSTTGGGLGNPRSVLCLAIRLPE